MSPPGLQGAPAPPLPSRGPFGWLVLDGTAIFDLEYSALKMLAEVEARVRARGAELWLAALNPEPRRVVERSPLGRVLGRERMFFDLEHAVERYRARGRVTAHPAATAGVREATGVTP